MADVTAFQKLQATLTDIGIPFRLTDDSEESTVDEDVMTVIEIATESVCEDGSRMIVLFLFRRDGTFKELAAF